MDVLYNDLANAIIIQAVSDYRKVLRMLNKHPYNKQALSECCEIEEFFRSGWFGILTKLNPEVLINQLKAEVTA